MYATGHITHEEEAKLPFFNDYEEAREWFKEKYGDSFILTSSEIIDDQICYFYYLILDHKVFEAGQKEKESKGIMTDAINFMGSYQEIQIMEDGSVHIVH
jgi:hypothetical protein